MKEINWISNETSHASIVNKKFIVKLIGSYIVQRVLINSSNIKSVLSENIPTQPPVCYFTFKNLPI